MARPTPASPQAKSSTSNSHSKGPSIPFLLGSKNLDEWRNTVLHTLAYNNLDKYVRDHVAEPWDRGEAKIWRRERLTAKMLIRTSLALVRDILLAEDWDEDENDPKTFFESAGDLVACMDELPIGSLVEEFCRIDRTKFDTLAAYQSRVYYLNKILPELGCEFGEVAVLWIVINGLKERYPRWYQDLSREMANSRVTWESLMRDMSTRAIKEPTEGHTGGGDGDGGDPTSPRGAKTTPTRGRGSSS